ncbi:MAG: hypothetical protein H6R32_64 [Candidatus Aminicenantes bacterium]|nr:hypothetical protein [Candidatus Aminicenantes bacterium]
MRNKSSALRFLSLAALIAAGLLAIGDIPARGGSPRGAFYSPANDQVFWFIHFSDIHIGTSGSEEANNLRWLVTTARQIIDPEFLVATGDLTDSTDGNFLGYPNGPYQAEWDEYKSILSAAGVDDSFYYDLPGNHDAYNDQYFAYYRANSVQGRATGGTQVSWTRTFPFGKYHFLGVCTPDNSGDGFSLFWPYGDYAGLDGTELTYIDSALNAPMNADADLTMLFGHHPVTDTGASDDTWLFYGHQEFVGTLDTHGASLYGYGHTHASSDVQFPGDSYTGNMTGGGIRYLNIDSLGKDSPYSYDVIAVDCNGVSSVPATVGTWPVVLITAPVDRTLGATANPYAYSVPAAADNPIRALVFDAGAVSLVQFRIDAEATWHPMSAVVSNPRLYEGIWNASTLAPGDHTITVQALGTTTRSHSITVTVDPAVAPNEPPVAVNDAYATDEATTLAITAPGLLANDTDADGDPLTASLVGSPANGVLALNADGSFNYTPNPGFSGPDSFLYAANDGTAASAAATVSVTVRAAGPDVVDVLTATYTQKTKKLHVEATSSAQPDAVLTVVGYGEMIWTATAGRYILDKRITAAPGDHVKVTSSRGGVDYYYFNGGANVPPVATNQSVTVLTGTPKAITLTATDANGDPLTYKVLSVPAHGDLSGTAPNLTYTPDDGYEGPDSFTFLANDGQIDGSAATVSITVSASTAEKVEVLLAEYRTKTRQLTVQATSSLQPAVTMEVVGYGAMTYDAALARYVFSKKVSTAPGATVTVRSSSGSTAIGAVTVK